VFRTQVDPHTPQLIRELLRRLRRVVGRHQIRDIAIVERLQEIGNMRQAEIASIDNPVHINDVGLCPLQRRLKF
jgi:hypothetical protein